MIILVIDLSHLFAKFCFTQNAFACYFSNAQLYDIVYSFLVICDVLLMCVSCLLLDEDHWVKISS